MAQSGAGQRAGVARASCGAPRRLYGVGAHALRRGTRTIGRSDRLYRHPRRHQRPQAGGRGESQTGGAGATRAAVAKPGHPGRGPGARFQQSAHRHPGQRAYGASGTAARIAGGGESGRDRNGRQPGGRFDEPDAGLLRQGPVYIAGRQSFASGGGSDQPAAHSDLEKDGDSIQPANRRCRPSRPTPPRSARS